MFNQKRKIADGRHCHPHCPHLMWLPYISPHCAFPQWAGIKLKYELSGDGNNKIYLRSGECINCQNLSDLETAKLELADFPKSKWFTINKYKNIPIPIITRTKLIGEGMSDGDIKTMMKENSLGECSQCAGIFHTDDLYWIKHLNQEFCIDCLEDCR